MSEVPLYRTFCTRPRPNQSCCPPPRDLEQVLDRNVQRFRGELVFKAHRRLDHSTLGLRVIKKKKKSWKTNGEPGPDSGPGFGQFLLILLLLYYSQAWS